MEDILLFMYIYTLFFFLARCIFFGAFSFGEGVKKGKVKELRPLTHLPGEIGWKDKLVRYINEVKVSKRGRGGRGRERGAVRGVCGG